MAAANPKPLPPAPTSTSTSGALIPRTSPDHSHDGQLSYDTSDDIDNDIDIENDLVTEHGSIYSADAGSIIGVSIGENQNLMKSPTTPAATKAQALESSATYFPTEPDGESHYFEEPQQETTSSDGSPNLVDVSPSGPADKPKDKGFPPHSFSPGCASTPASTSAAETKQKNDKHTSLVSSVLGSSRKRSSSGSVLIENIRKILPSLTSLTQTGHSAATEAEQNASGPRVLGPAGVGIARSNNLSSGHGKPQSDGSPGQEPSSPSPSLDADAGIPDGPNHDPELTPPRPNLLRRATSDQSLYLRRAPTGASHFDDYSNFIDVSDMTNSRFKAITDSFQDSSLHLPKFPSIGRGDCSSPEDTKLHKATVHNTRANTGTSPAEPSVQHSKESSQATMPTRTSRHPNIKSALSQMTGDLLIMGGYRGSILREAKPPHRQIWVPVKVGLNLRKADLEVGLTREDELKMEETIIPDGTLSHIGPVDICRRLIRKCERCPNSKEGRLRVHDYGYDWRLSPDLLVDRLIAHLESLPCNGSETPKNERGAWVIAHSLGGLLVRSAANKRPELFAGIVYAGTPQNCVNILGPLRNGDDVLFSSRVLTAQVNFTLRTSYALLPQNGRCFINKASGEFYDLDFFDVRTWDEHCLSPCIKAPKLRHTVEKRRSILNHSPEPSAKPGKPSSWFNNMSKDDLSDRTYRSGPQRIREKATDKRDDIVDAAESAVNNKPDGPFSPNLADGQQRKSSIATQVNIPLPAATEYLERTLRSVLTFKKGLSHRPELQARNAYPAASVLFAKNTPTVYGAFVESREAIAYDDAYDDLAFAAGDGVVLASAAQLPPGYRCVRNGRIESERGHVGLLGDLEGVGRCLLAVVDARKRGVGRGAHVRRKDSQALPFLHLGDHRIML